MSIKKFVSSLFVVSVIASMLVACSTPAPAATSAPQPTSAPQIVEVTKIVAGTPVTEKVVVTATTAPTVNPYDDNAPITVWIDADRQPAIDAYIKAFPDKGKLIKAVQVDREQFPAKVLLFNNTNQGWPDVVFAEPRLVGRVADDAHHFPLDLKPWVPANVISNFDGADGCTFGDKVYSQLGILGMGGDGPSCTTHGRSLSRRIIFPLQRRGDRELMVGRLVPGAVLVAAEDAKHPCRARHRQQFVVGDDLGEFSAKVIRGEQRFVGKHVVDQLRGADAGRVFHIDLELAVIDQQVRGAAAGVKIADERPANTKSP
jgi:hypothetical protein